MFSRYSYNIGITKEESIIISAIRVFAMFSIVVLHLTPTYSSFRQILVVGVDLFFIVSGFLYGQKEINSTLRWLKNRFIRILTPVYVFYCITSLLLLLFGDIGNLNLFSILLQVLNLNGFIDRAGIGNVFTGHLWYISFILICYIITPFLQRIRGRCSFKIILCYLAIISIVESVVICNVRIQSFTVWIPGIFLYVLTYFFGAYWDKTVRMRDYILLSVLTIVCLFVRCSMKAVADANVEYETFYVRVVVQYTMAIFGCWIFLTLYAVSRYCKNFIKKTSSLICYFDRISFEIYIIHQILCCGVLSVTSLTSNYSLNLVVFATMTILCSVVLKNVSEFIISIFEKSCERLGNSK